MTHTNSQIHVRAPARLKAMIERLAAQNRRSLNAEVVFGLEFYVQHIEQTEKAPDPALESKPDAFHAE
ncbi:hypothetical protein [Komagataeibacter europaeus]|uniref:hypothetical protein n=1 Tax=Komagataeibacter europaeus TaxID=33995 RepID=UPI0012FC42A8|nr:hypothetical protein [Komagataeibacter europaeus]